MAECSAELRLHAFADGSQAFLTCDLTMAEHPGLNHHDPVYETWWRECDQSCGHPHRKAAIERELTGSAAATEPPASWLDSLPGPESAWPNKGARALTGEDGSE